MAKTCTISDTQASLTRPFVIYAGSIALLFAAGTPAFSEPTSAGRMASGSAASTQTDLTVSKAGIPGEYADTGALQGIPEELEDSKYLNATVYNIEGEEIVKIQQVLKETKSGEIEYTVVVSKESKL
jgi:hypothetical protein